MKFKIIVLSFFQIILIISCKKQGNVKDVRYAIVERYNANYLKDSLRYAPYDYYVGNNIIFPKDSKFFYYHNSGLKCSTGWKVSNPPFPIDFKLYPLIRFKSLTRFLDFLKNNSENPKLLMLISDSDTIRNNKYFRLLDTMPKLDRIYVIATRKVTPDESIAIKNLYYKDFENFKTH